MKTQKLKIVIIDDQPERSAGWAKQIQNLLGESAEVSAPELDDVRIAVKAVFNRRKEAVDGFDVVENLATKSSFDAVDVLVLDFDLRNMDTGDSHDWTTGAEVAVAARAFTKVKTILLVNRLGTNRFDLDMGKAGLTKADIDIGGAQIDNPGLWATTNFEQYRPWFWPPLLEWSQKFEEVVKYVQDNFDTPILSILGLNIGDGSFEESINKEDWLELGIDPQKGTFRELVKLSQYLNPRDKDALEKSISQSARIAATIMRSWFEKVVIPSQETLIDAPHLAYLMPWLLVDPKNINCWNKSADLMDPFSAFKPEVSNYLYSNTFTSRPIFYRRKIGSDANLVEPQGFNYNELPDLVFSEDLSQFIDFKYAKPYPSGLRSVDDQRYVADPTKLPSRDAHKIADVSYEPAAKFAI